MMSALASSWGVVVAECLAMLLLMAVSSAVLAYRNDRDGVESRRRDAERVERVRMSAWRQRE